MAPRIVLITGANSGVGYAACRVLATTPEYEFHVVMTGRSIEKVEASRTEIIASAKIPDLALRLSALQLDVTDPSSVRTAADTVSKKWGHVDALINNAAIGALSLDDDIYTRFTTCLQTNVTGPAVVEDTFRPLLLQARTKPYSVFVSSGAGSFARTADVTRQRGPEPPSDTSPYHVSKAALNMLALKEHMKYRDEIKVFAMTPGFVISNLRGTSEEERTGWGLAGDPLVAGATLLSMLRGERDEDVGRLVSGDGVYPW
ncbi:hypothetical protein PV08_04057 [Exophiala spinifera]|uniref:NAD(P)-binding protein n=1 Tax=Exophiala spinifera TaxID=91928 RepID=A0A0D1ZVZ7_9EURO|nr:uncharacterized protein PV08_04057 [Exophiala spinifera]KIW16867.1 hypothetical protein PV08_04057 [Exophiala spinifera]